MADYTDSGFDAFLTRSVDNTPRSNLNAGGPVSTQLPLERGQFSGSIGNLLQIGNVRINGKGYISIYDDSGNEVARFGDLGA